jgi:hypothetical protein
MKGEDLANELCVSRMRSEFESVSPRSCMPCQHDSQSITLAPPTSGGNSPANSLNSFSSLPMLTSTSLFSSRETIAWVPQAFWMVCAAKKRSFAASWSYLPSLGVSPRVSPVGYLKRKITP